ncbi:MAG: hypothetical protein B7Z08_01080 [Sphingomonadales bacterium 32-68-7]|nr:MAG: hypothetical protein B7Z33_03245 [Sphingomonadales bacterium 12-68-11]OYX10434.1 MAG: hypothetical protein B7Z08_01080 [Sphingomonadales bacterium 32-68-7]
MATLDKPEAAERMIVSAIAMTERGDDPLAIHVVAASALSLLRELIDKSGDPYVAQVLKLGLFTAAAARLQGEPIPLPTTPEIDAVIDRVVAGIDAGEIAAPADLILNLTADELRGMLGYIVRPYNFLKHADRDPLATLDEGDLDPEGVIIHALTAFSMVRPGKALPEEIKPFLIRHKLA